MPPPSPAPRSGSPATGLAPLPDADTFFVSDLVGCELMVGGRVAGCVTAVHGAPANDVLEVSGDDGVLLSPSPATRSRRSIRRRA